MENRQRCHELAEFLRARREQIAPAEVGLPGGGRRRTPGLRREEVAQLAGIGVAWYTWLEQGKDIRVSAQALEGIAQALQLSLEERSHLFQLARHEKPIVMLPLSETVDYTIQRILDRQADPAYVTNARRDVLAWNVAACVVFGDYNVLPPEDRNILRRMFLNPEQRRFHVHWEEDARDILARFRADAGQHLGEPRFQTLIAELENASPEFRVWWPQHEVRRTPQGHKEFQHPAVGHLMMQYTALEIIAQPDQRLVIFTPDDETARKLDCVLGDPAAGHRGSGRAYS